MIVDDKNKSSINGIEKAGFERCGTVRKSNILNIYTKYEGAEH
jgi:RimJ/RimL family protein N-acetyltransferase